jgi:phosphoribosyl 1,2-cyclic phosphodiesterase/CheY-like chemotaxis protein
MPDKKKHSFFIVDSDPNIVDWLKALLEEAGHSTNSETSSTTALPKISAKKPDCVIIDMTLPGMDGLELCKSLRSRSALADAKLIVLSSKAYEYDRKRAFEYGADGFITKPLNAGTFVQKVEHIIQDQVELTFWGVRGTLPVPGGDALRYGGNTSCVSLEFSRGQFFIFDAGTGIKALANHLLKNNRAKLEAKIFISHPHWDHINALPFFTPLYIQGNDFEICGARHGDTTTRELISAQMDGVYFPITLKEFASRVYFHDLEEEPITFDGINIKTTFLNHPGKCLGYRVDYKGRSICYITDNELYLEDNEYHNPFYVKRLADFVRETDILITDCTYTDEEYKTKVGWGHSCISQVVDLAHSAEVKALYLFHHDPDQSDDDIDAKHETAQALLKEIGSKTVCVAPHEGMTVKI